MTISVVIPVYNEERIVEKQLTHLIHTNGPFEIIVVDGGSNDSTPALVQKYKQVKLIKASKGRGLQMNIGAHAACGDVLLFLHADCFLPENALMHIESALQDKTISGGRFQIRFDLDLFSMRFHGFMSKFLFFSFGDQGFFVRKKAFEDLNGFDESVPFEDVDFFKRLRKKYKVVILKTPLLVSARRYILKGPIKQKIVNVWLLLSAILGFDAHKLKNKFYPDIR